MSSQEVHYSVKLAKLREQMHVHDIQGYLIPRGDEYLGEFVAEYAERLHYMTGFTGSAGMAFVTQDTAHALTDARYTLQIAGQVDTALFETGDYIRKPIEEWVTEQSKAGDVIGYDPRLHTAAFIERLQGVLSTHGMTMKPVAGNLVDSIWENQPDKPQGAVELFPEDIAGLGIQEKIETVQDMLDEGEGQLILTLPDSIAWLLNVRGCDTAYIPQVLSTAIVDLKNMSVQWFVGKRKISTEVETYIDEHVTIHAPEELETILCGLTGTVYLDNNSAPIWFQSVLEQGEAELVNCKDPCILPKAQKTQAEQEALKKAHIADGMALVKFMYWLEQETAQGSPLSEYEVAEKLEEFRAQHTAYRGASFPTICGFGRNGAIVHYRATPENNAPIGKDNLLLIDSGGQYMGDGFAGTTDITRTIAIGNPTIAMKQNFTLVLKGHIALSQAVFPLGTTGAQIDVYARKPLWDHNIDFNHGTGHGVGCYLAVHEEAAGISPRGKDPLQPGMLLSNEPGYYEEGAYGIRTENLLLVREQGTNDMTGLPMLGFDVVSFAPIDLEALDISLLSMQEKEWINKYHAQVRENLSSSLLSEEEISWLEQKTRAIS